MAAQLQITGTLTQGPPSVTGTTLAASAIGTVPAGVSQVPILLTPSTKQSAVCTGLRHKSLNSANAFQTLSGLGSTDDVTTGDTLYIKSDAPIQLQLTMQNPAGGSAIVSVVNLYGTGLWEFQSGGYLTGIAAQGVANLEMLISGPQ